MTAISARRKGYSGSNVIEACDGFTSYVSSSQTTRFQKIGTVDATSQKQK